MSLTDYAAREANVEIGLTEFPSLFYPLPFNKYVVVCVSGDSPSRSYRHFSKVFELLNMDLEFSGIKVVQIGAGKDYPIRGAYDLRGALSLRQAAHIINGSLAFIGCDHVYARIAAIYNVATVIAVGATYGSDILPRHEAPFKIVESHRNGLKPSYLDDENPALVDLVNPEDIAKEVMGIFDFEWDKSFKTIRIGKSFYEERIDFIPDFPVSGGALNGRNLVCRYDLSPNPAALFQFYHFYGGPLFTDRPIDPKLFEEFGGKIPHTVYFLDGEYSPEFVKFLHSIPRPYDLVSSKTGKDLEAMKLELFDYNQIKSLAKPNYDGVKEGHKFVTNRLFLSKGQMFPSVLHWRKGVGLSNTMTLTDIDNKDWWDCYDHFYIYE